MDNKIDFTTNVGQLQQIIQNISIMLESNNKEKINTLLSHRELQNINIQLEKMWDKITDSFIL